MLVGVTQRQAVGRRQVVGEPHRVPDVVLEHHDVLAGDEVLIGHIAAGRWDVRQRGLGGLFPGAAGEPGRGHDEGHRQHEMLSSHEATPVRGTS